MFYSEQLLSKEGPLAHVWLAANLERKLTKHQLLATNISKTSEAIATTSTSNDQVQVEPLALRLTGTLLYGIVRIYSRKAKYLLDDVSDALLRLKTAFRSSNSIILPPQATLMPSVKQITLQDTVTANDLLWQEPLNFDDDDETTNNNNNNNNEFEENINSFDQSIELGRGFGEVDELAGNNGDDLELDFDLGDAGNHDMSIEVGRDRETSLADESALPDLTFGEIEGGGAPDFGDFNDFGNGPEFDQEQPQTPRSPPAELIVISSPTTQQQRKKRSNKFAESDVVRTAKRRLVVDEVTELSSAQIREQLQHSNVIDESPLEPTLEERFQSICQSSIKTNLTVPSISLPIEQQQDDNENFQEDFDLGHNNTQLEESNLNEFNPDFEQDQAAGLEFDFLPELVQAEEELLETEAQLQNKDQIAEKISEIVTTKKETTFSFIVENSSDEINFPKKHATNFFFELLVMASSDKIALKQDALFSEIDITSRF